MVCRRRASRALFAVVALGMLGLSGCMTTPPAEVVEIGEPVAPAMVAAAPAEAPAVEPVDPFLALYEEWKGTRHKYGGLSKTGIDCSGFVLVGFRNIYGVKLPRTTRDQARLGVDVDRDELIYGDLVFFKTGGGWRHVGIYLGDDRFLHVSSKIGVTISSMHNPYWTRRYWKAVRIEPSTQLAAI